MEFTRLENRAVLVVEGEDRLTFLQGLISNDINKASPEQAIWAGFLTPQGKFQYDLFITIHGDRVLLDVEADRIDAFAKRLGMFKLRSKVTINRAADLAVWAAWGPGAIDAFWLAAEAGRAEVIESGTVAVDPRLSVAGLRLVLPLDAATRIFKDKDFCPAPFSQWDLMRLELGLPDGSRDMQVDGNLLLELGFEELNGVDFQKGCYMGQETTTRSKFRNLIKRRLTSVRIDGPVPAAGTVVTLDGVEVGHMGSAVGQIGLATIRLDKMEGGELICGDAKLTPHKPDWAVFPAVD